MAAPDRRSTSAKLRRRDLLLLPLIVIATVLAVVIPAEVAVRHYFPYNEADRCVVYGDTRPSAFHAKPNCESSIKIPEGPWTTMRYNECGYRSADPCTPKRPDSLRVAIVGSSLSAGYLVPYDKGLTALAKAMLGRTCRLPVDVQNLGAEGNMGARLLESTKAATALRPDALVFVVSPTDLALDPDQTAKPIAKPETNLMREIKVKISESRLFYMASYLLLRNDDNYVPIYLRSGNNADFMRAPLSAPWRKRLANLDRDIGGLKAVADRSAVPLLVIFVPQRAQAAMIAVPRLGKGMAPHLIQTEIERIAARHGAAFADVTRAIAPATSTHMIFYAMNGHLNGDGHGLLARTTVKALLAQHIPAFDRHCGPNARVAGQGGDAAGNHGRNGDAA